MTKQKSIAIIIPYFGRFPWYFDFFVYTCKYNPSIDFLIFSDDLLYKNELPKNVQIINKTFIELKTLIGEKLKIAIDFDDPYKLCDFKPAYGFIFEKYLKKYDFWGHGDIDVIFGNIRCFITNKVLLENDVICIRHDFISGYFTLFKNNSKINTLFKQSKDYKKVFTQKRHFCFDETNFHFAEFGEEKHYSEIKSEIESMTHVLKRLHEKKHIKVYFDFHVIEGIPGNLKWEEGILLYKKKYEILLYHMIKFKKTNKPSRVPKIMKKLFFISSTRIY